MILIAKTAIIIIPAPDKNHLSQTVDNLIWENRQWRMK